MREVLEPPAPVDADGAGHVHAAAAVEGAYILHGDDDETRVRRIGKLDELIADVLRPVGTCVQKLRDRRPLRGIELLCEPANRRIVVVRTRVDDGVFGHGDSDAAHLVEVQAEVQNLHARIAAVVTQSLDFIGDDAKILGDDGKVLD